MVVEDVAEADKEEAEVKLPEACAAAVSVVMVKLIVSGVDESISWYVCFAFASRVQENIV